MQEFQDPPICADIYVQNLSSQDRLRTNRHSARSPEAWMKSHPYTTGMTLFLSVCTLSPTYYLLLPRSLRRGSFQPIDLGQNSDNEDAESWLVSAWLLEGLSSGSKDVCEQSMADSDPHMVTERILCQVAPTPRAGSFCSQYWAPGTKSVYDDDISPTMSCRSSLAGDAFPPLNQSPDPNLATMPNSARSTGRYQGLRSSTSRIPRPSNGPPSARANDPLRQSMPTLSSRGKYATPGAPYRPSTGNYPPSARSTPAQRNLAARQVGASPVCWIVYVGAACLPSMWILAFMCVHQVLVA
eukprot:scaffold3931_cov17-Tisochrysis_lutea.AAC.5